MHYFHQQNTLSSIEATERVADAVFTDHGELFVFKLEGSTMGGVVGVSVVGSGVGSSRHLLSFSRNSNDSGHSYCFQSAISSLRFAFQLIYVHNINKMADSFLCDETLDCQPKVTPFVDKNYVLRARLEQRN
jgi:hypothetical protein